MYSNRLHDKMVSIATGGEEEQPKAKPQQPVEDRKVVHENFVTKKGKPHPFLFTTNLSLIFRYNVRIYQKMEEGISLS